MNPKAAIQQIFEAFGLRVFLQKSVPRGTDFFHDLKKDFPGYSIDLVVDVGANEGSTVAQFLRETTARVIALEPASENFVKLDKKFRLARNRVKCLKVAAAAHVGESSLALSANGLCHSLKEIPGAMNHELVETITIDSLLEEEGVRNVGFLKIDTEGLDLEVLRGAKTSLRNQLIDFVQVESAMNLNNRTHCDFEDIRVFLFALDYEPFGVYNQIPEHYRKLASLRCADIVFVSTKVLKEFGRYE